MFLILIFLKTAKQQEDPLGICSLLEEIKFAHETM